MLWAWHYNESGKGGRVMGEISETARLLRNLNDAVCEEAMI